MSRKGESPRDKARARRRERLARRVRNPARGPARRRDGDAKDGDEDGPEDSPEETALVEAAPAELERPARLLHLRWDLDKTYLRTEFDTLRDLYRTFMQKAEDKVAIAGARVLLKELMDPHDGIPRRVTFISGSPSQMRRTLTRKLQLDGIVPDVFILKPNLSNLLRGRFRALRGQVGYKLKALLHSHMAAVEVDEYLFGDDAEQDAFIYSLYADILAGRVDATAMVAILNACKVYRRDTDEIMALHGSLYASGEVVRRIFIHLEARSPLGRFRPYGGRVVPVYNYFQAAMLLLDAAVLRVGAVWEVIAAMEATGYTPARFANSLQELLRRGVLAPIAADRAIEELAAEGARRGRDVDRFTRRLRTVTADLRSQPRPPPPWETEVNYLGLYHAARFRRQRYRLLGTGIRILD